MNILLSSFFSLEQQEIPLIVIFTYWLIKFILSLEIFKVNSFSFQVLQFYFFSMCYRSIDNFSIISENAHKPFPHVERNKLRLFLLFYHSLVDVLLKDSYITTRSLPTTCLFLLSASGRSLFTAITINPWYVEYWLMLFQYLHPLLKNDDDVIIQLSDDVQIKCFDEQFLKLVLVHAE